MLGIDLTKISRFENSTEAFIDKILSVEEKVLYEESSNKARFLAKRWSVKEALFKADNSLNTFKDINLIENGREVEFKGFEISTSTEDDYYIAIVTKEN